MKKAADIYIAGSVRTPIGSFSGALSTVSAPVLGSAVITESIARAGIDSKAVDEVIFGNVIGAGLGQNVARQCTIGAGLANSVGACTVNKVCGSSLKTVMMAAQAITCGDAEVVVAGGTENMSAAPYLLPKARAGYRMGNGVLVDAMINDGLWDVYNDAHMGTYGERCAEKYGFTREEQDDFAIESYKRAINSTKEGIFASEIVPIEVKGRKGVVKVDADEEPQRFNEEKFRKLSPAFGANGTVTAGNASSINDGAASVVVLSADKVDALGVKPEAKILGYATFSCEPEWFTIAPVGAINKLMKNLNLKVADVDLFEINEAFSVVPMAAMRDIDIPRAKLNVLGGAVALGHPIGASGARTLVTLLNAMRRNDAKIGINALCIGGGEAVAMAVERC